MNIWEIIIGVVIILICLVLIGVIMLQKGDTRGMGGMAGESSSDSYLESNKGRTFDAMLARVTKIAAVLFFLLTILMGVISIVNK